MVMQKISRLLRKKLMLTSIDVCRSVIAHSIDGAEKHGHPITNEIHIWGGHCIGFAEHPALGTARRWVPLGLTLPEPT